MSPPPLCHNKCLEVIIGGGERAIGRPLYIQLFPLRDISIISTPFDLVIEYFDLYRVLHCVHAPPGRGVLRKLMSWV